MSLTLVQLKDLHDKAYNFSSITRERASDDSVFYFVTNWDDNILSDSQLAYRGEFDVLRKAGRDIMASLAQMPSQIDFFPINDTRDEDAEFADSHYRAGTNNNASKEAFKFADQDCVVCGYGAWQLKAHYCSDKMGNNNQEIKREFIPEANNTVFFDPNDTTIDKRKAKYVSRLKAFSEDGYKDLKEKLTGEEVEKVNPSNFDSPEHSYTFPWITGQSDRIYVTEFYYREKIDDKVLTLEDPFGETLDVLESEIQEVEDELLDSGFEIIDEKEIKRYRVTLYIASGEEILNGEYDPETGERGGEVIVGEHLPIIPQYGEYAVIEGELHWEGVTRLAKDPQRLRNFQLSFLADIVSRSPRQKPIFFPEQIAGYEDMYEITGADNNYPYLLAHRKAGDGSDLPPGPAGVMPEQQMPTALIQSIALSKEAVEDTANPGLPQSVSDPDASGKAILALQAQIDKQNFIYQDHRKFARRRDAEVWLSMAREVFDTPRTQMIEMPNGQKKEVQVLETILDEQTGELVTIRDYKNAEFDLSSKIGPDYVTQKEQTLDRLSMMAPNIKDPELAEMIEMKIFMLMDGVDFDDVRDYVNKKMVLNGYKEPETDEETAMMEAQAQAAQEPDAMTLAAQAEMVKGQADMLEEKRKGIEMQLDSQNDQAQTKIDAYNAETKRIQAMASVKESESKTQNTNVDTLSKNIDNQAKVIQLSDIQQFTDEQILQQIAQG
jgi:hypothetical protein